LRSCLRPSCTPSPTGIRRDSSCLVRCGAIFRKGFSISLFRTLFLFLSKVVIWRHHFLLSSELFLLVIIIIIVIVTKRKTPKILADRALSLVSVSIFFCLLPCLGLGRFSLCLISFTPFPSPPPRYMHMVHPFLSTGSELSHTCT